MRLELAAMTIGLFACGEVKSTTDANHDTGAIDTPTHDAPSGATPKLHWTLDGNTNNNGSVNGFALATPGGVSFVNGKVGMAASFGSGQFANVAGMRNVIGTFAKATIAFWLKEPGTLANAAVLDCINRNTSPFGGVQLGFATTTASLCVSTTTNSLLGGSCMTTPAPSANTFHHWIIRYNGTGTGASQGGPTEVYIDDALVLTRVNDTSNNPVFSTTGMSDTLFVGAAGTVVDDVRIYDQVFTIDEQCTQIIGGTLSGGTCVLP